MNRRNNRKGVIFLILTLFQLVLSSNQHYSQNYRYTLTNTGDDDEIANQETVLDVAIVPPLRLNLFDTPTELSQSGLDAVVTAMNNHATKRMEIYFRGSIYFFARVEFEILETHRVQRSQRKRRVFETEEKDARSFDFDGEGGEFLEDGAEMSSNIRSKGAQMEQEFEELDESDPNRRTQSLHFGTSVLLGGKFKFSLFPSASSAECNGQLLKEMQRDWFMHQELIATGHPELQDIKQWLITTVKETYAPSPNPSDVPSSKPSPSRSKQPSSPTKQPSASPFHSPSSKPSSSPSSTPASQPSKSPTMTPSDEPSRAHSVLPTSQFSLTPTSSHSIEPTLNPTAEPSVKPSTTHSAKPSDSPSNTPSLKASDTPSLIHSQIPSFNPSMSPSPTHEFFPSDTPSITLSDVPSTIPTTIPSSTATPSGGPSDVSDTLPVNNGKGNSDDIVSNGDEGPSKSLIPIIVASSIVSLVVFIGSGLFVKKVRKDREANHLPIHMKDLDGDNHYDDDDDDDDSDDLFPSPRAIPPLLPALEESHESEDLHDYFSEPSAIATTSVQTAQTGKTNPSVCSVQTEQTAKANNLSEKGNTEYMENKWLANSPMKNTALVRKSMMKPPMPPSSTQHPFPLKLEDNGFGNGVNSESAKDLLSPENITLGAVGAASGAVTSGNTIGPNLMKFFVRGDGDKTRSRSSSLGSSPGQRSSPIIDITSSKVSKEEFEKGWDLDMPFGWSPQNRKENKQKYGAVNKDDDDDDIENAFDAFNDVDGSFPRFDENENLVQPQYPKSASSRNSRMTGSIGDSTAYQSAIHPLDWSNKGSEYDGTSIGDSTYTDNTANREMGRVSWDQMKMDTPGQRSPLGVNRSEMNSSNFMSTTTQDFQTPKSALTDRSRQSFYGTSSNGESSPSSRGSSKQLINDLVWLEKKIADVRKRVDRLDGDDVLSTLSPPITPEVDRSNPMGSPISHSIVCRDITAPPGKLNIVIHSTKDGPAIHSVKPGSALEGQLFTGDLVVAVDDTDTRTLNAVDVMEMMAQKSDSHRKITVIHFDNAECVV